LIRSGEGILGFREAMGDSILVGELDARRL